MRNTKRLDHSAASAVAAFRHAAMNLVIALGVCILLTTASPAPVSLASTTCIGSASKPCALIMGGTSVPTPDDAYVDIVMDHYLTPLYGGRVQPVAVTTPQEGFPLTGLLRVLGVAFGSQIVWGPGGAGWPDEPWWKLSGLFDLSYEQSLQAGVVDLETAMAMSGDDHLVVYGYSQGAMIAVIEKRKLAGQFPVGTTAPDIDFVLSGDLNLPNGGVLARFPGFRIPILELVFNGAEPTDTQFNTAVITRQYDGLADFPLYPLNVIADLNALLGAVYVHLNDLDVSLAHEASSAPPSLSTHGDSSYYFFETADLPLFGPLRTLGVPEPVIDVFEPFFRVIVELGYDRTIPPWEPTPARLIPPIDPGQLVADLSGVISEGIDNALALVGARPPLRRPASAVEAEIGGVVEPRPSTGQDGEVVRQTATETSDAANPAMSSTAKPPRNQSTLTETPEPADEAPPGKDDRRARLPRDGIGGQRSGQSGPSGEQTNSSHSPAAASSGTASATHRSSGDSSHEDSEGSRAASRWHDDDRPSRSGSEPNASRSVTTVARDVDDGHRTRVGRHSGDSH